MGLPQLDESLVRLTAVSGVENFDPDTPLLQSEVDSLDLIEWLYSLQESYPELDVDESIFEDIDDTVTFRVIHDQIVGVA